MAATAALEDGAFRVDGDLFFCFLCFWFMCALLLLSEEQFFRIRFAHNFRWTISAAPGGVSDKELSAAEEENV